MILAGICLLLFQTGFSQIVFETWDDNEATKKVVARQKKSVGAIAFEPIDALSSKTWLFDD